jgi:hypothetical protein
MRFRPSSIHVPNFVRTFVEESSGDKQDTVDAKSSGNVENSFTSSTPTSTSTSGIYEEVLQDRKKYEDDLKKELIKSLSVNQYSIFGAEEVVVRAGYGSDIADFTLQTLDNFLYVSEYKVGEAYGALLCWRHLVKESSYPKIEEILANIAPDYLTGEDWQHITSQITFPTSVSTVKTKIEATHYEVYRKNHASPNSGYKKIGMNTYGQLIEERDRGLGKGLLPYVREVLKMDNVNDSSLLYFLDTNIEADAIYSYKIIAIRVCENEMVDYAYAIRSAGFLDSIPIQQLGSHQSNRLVNMSSKLYGDPRFRWMISLVNRNVDYFGNRDARTTSPPTTSPEDTLLNYVNNVSHLNRMIKESVSKFGAYKTYIHLFKQLGGLNQTIFNILQGTRDNAVITDGANSFDFTKFKKKVSEEYAIFDITLKALNVADSQEVVERVFGVGVNFPPQEGSVNIGDILGATQMFDFIERIFHLLLIAEDRVEEVTKGLQQVIIEDAEVQNVISKSSAEYIEQAHTDALDILGVDNDSIASFFDLSTLSDDDVSVE